MIEWISVKDKLPDMHEEKDEDGAIYHVSDTLLCWDGDEQDPIAIGVYEGGKWYANGVGQPDVTHWALINDPEGKIVNLDCRCGW